MGILIGPNVNITLDINFTNYWHYLDVLWKMKPKSLHNMNRIIIRFYFYYIDKASEIEEIITLSIKLLKPYKIEIKCALPITSE